LCATCNDDRNRVLNQKEQAVSDIQKFQHRVEEIEAVQITLDNIEELAVWCNGEVFRYSPDLGSGSTTSVTLSVHTRVGHVALETGYWLIKNSTGRFEGMTDANFQRKYVVAQERREAAREAASHVHGFFGKPDAAWPNQ
jgi:hypothetical protein